MQVAGLADLDALCSELARSSSGGDGSRNKSCSSIDGSRGNDFSSANDSNKDIVRVREAGDEKISKLETWKGACEIEENYMGERVKMVTAYYGSLIKGA